MSTLSLRVSEKDAEIFRAYAKFKKLPLSEVLRDALMEQIETEYDLKVFIDYEISKESIRPLDELWKDLSL